jgi:hypothetical protein
VNQKHVKAQVLIHGGRMTGLQGPTQPKDCFCRGEGESSARPSYKSALPFQNFKCPAKKGIIYQDLMRHKPVMEVMIGPETAIGL